MRPLAAASDGSMLPSNGFVSTDTVALMRMMAALKSAIVAYILLFLLGALGLHRIYLELISGKIMALLGIGGWICLGAAYHQMGPPWLPYASMAVLILNGIICIIDLFWLPFLTRTANDRLVDSIVAKL